ncbi:heme ABC transporter permease CcmB [Deinococcus psychrotolerans]|uniref:Heme exporter protein B n=2 Tax=Deinococcus TaxID=1298 RepID=A0A553UUD8_9DEIO|nr:MULTISPECIES: heme exporter protein CcmB [Deinococcus]AZI43149.1 heme ABC transporter permease CcmB [Deinococcus psychrotolerans]TSA83814.1 heme ABC transporter permease CcmB [Deinococcus detaillensis]
MNEGWQHILTIARKDARLAGRTRDTLLATLFYAALVLLVLGLALGPDDARLRPAAAGAVWASLALSSAIASGRAFAQEQEAGALEQLTLYPGPHGALYLGKWLGTWLQLLVLAAVIVPLGLLLFGAAGGGQALPWPALLLTAVLGVTGLSASSTFYAAITVNLRAREALLPALAFPLLVPVVLATVKSTSLLLDGGWSGEVAGWLSFLTAFDIGTLIVCTLLFPFAVE